MDNSVNQKRIQIIGIGNEGCNIVSNLARLAEDELYVLCDCDMEEIGVKNTDNCKTVIFDKDILYSPSDSSHLYGQVIEKQTDLVFVIACLGGCFGTEATPLFVKESLKAGKRTIGIVTLPFQLDGDMTHDKSLDALRKIAANTDSMFILNNHYLEKHHSEKYFLEAIKEADNIIGSIISTLKLVF